MIQTQGVLSSNLRGATNKLPAGGRLGIQHAHERVSSDNRGEYRSSYGIVGIPRTGDIVEVKMSKSSQTTQSIDNLDQNTIELARISEENYWKLREELRIKYSEKK